MLPSVPAPSFSLSPHHTFLATLTYFKQLIPDSAPQVTPPPPSDLPAPVGQTQIEGFPVATIPFDHLVLPPLSYTQMAPFSPAYPYRVALPCHARKWDILPELLARRHPIGVS